MIPAIQAILDGAQIKPWWEGTTPWCTRLEDSEAAEPCPSWEGKRCLATGHDPTEDMCEAAIHVMVSFLAPRTEPGEVPICERLTSAHRAGRAFDVPPFTCKGNACHRWVPQVRTIMDDRPALENDPTLPDQNERSIETGLGWCGDNMCRRAWPGVKS